MKVLSLIAMLAAAVMLQGASFVPGQVGSGLKGRAGLVYDNTKITTQSGSLMFWFKSDKPAAEIKDGMAVCFGVVGDGWCYVALHRGQLVVNYRLQKGGYSRAAAPVKDLEPGKFHHIAVVWGVRKKTSFARLYINGKLKSYSRLTLPAKFTPGKLAVGYNSGYWKGPDFPGVIDELALFDAPVSPETVKQVYETGKAGKNLPDMPGLLFYAPFDGSAAVRNGQPTPAEEAQKLLRAAARKTKIKKYDDELDFNYSFSAPCPEEKIKGTLNDGNDNTAVNWRQRQVSVICEFNSTRDVSEIEIVTRKYTKWYRLRQFQVSWDDGSGNFNTPTLIDTYAKDAKYGKELIDSSCKHYVYSVKNPGKVCRVKITPVGDAYFGICEIRIRGK